jgi:hypothetical protein
MPPRAAGFSLRERSLRDDATIPRLLYQT